MKSELSKRILSSIILIPIAIFFIFQGSVFFVFFLSIFFLASSYEWIKMNKKDSFKILGLFYLLLVSYLAYLFSENFFFPIYFSAFNLHLYRSRWIYIWKNF